MRITRDIIKEQAKDLLFMVIGIAMFAVGFCGFILPEKIVVGAVAGIAALVYYVTGIPAGAVIFTLNVALLLLAFKALSRQFIIRTLIGVALLSVFVGVAQPFFEANPLITVGNDTFMHVLIGASLAGAGLGLIFSHNGSTGGTDIILAILNKYFSISFGRAMQMIDFTIISSSFLIYHSAEKIIYGLAYTLIAAFVCDYVVNGTRQTVQFLVISKEYDKIADYINQRLHRGVTLVNGKGWYTKQDAHILIILARKYESQGIFRLIKALDPKALVTQSFCHGIFGEGFDKMK